MYLVMAQLPPWMIYPQHQVQSPPTFYQSPNLHLYTDFGKTFNPHHHVGGRVVRNYGPHLDITPCCYTSIYVRNDKVLFIRSFMIIWSCHQRVSDPSIKNWLPYHWYYHGNWLPYHWYYHFCLPSYWLLPGFVLKRMIMDNFTADEVDPDIADSIDFMVERVSHHFFVSILALTITFISFF